MKHLTIPCVVLFFVASASSQEIGYVDLCGLTIRESTRHPRTIGGGCGMSAHAVPTQQIKVTLLSLDKATYHFGEDVIFEVEVKNIGKTSLVIPWTPHRADVEPNDLQEPFEYFVGVVVIHFKDAKQRELTLSEGLYGSRAAPGTLRELRPGEWFVLRGREKMEMLGSDWGREQLAESGWAEAKVSAAFREDIGAYSSRNGGSDSQWCILQGPNEANAQTVTVAPR
jgi:hypothetical protein